MRARRLFQHALIGATALVGVTGHYLTGRAEPGPASRPTLTYVAPVVARAAGLDSSVLDDAAMIRRETETSLAVLGTMVRRTSHPRALADAFRSYYAYRVEHPDVATKPYLYFVDYGLPSTTPRGYVFDMEARAVVDGPFMVAHGRGSAARGGVPTRFSNRSGSAATSLGLYVAQELYGFFGHADGRGYRSIGMRLMGVSDGWNDNARSRGVVAHGAPYVTASSAGRSEGCPAMEEPRARRLLPKLSGGGLVFLFAPEPSWMASDRWVRMALEG